MNFNLMTKLINQKNNQTGAGLVEYFVIIAFIILAAVITLYSVGSSTSETIQEAGSAISGDTTILNLNNKDETPEPTPNTCGNEQCEPSDRQGCPDCDVSCEDVECNPCQVQVCPPVDGQSCVTDDSAGGCPDNEHCFEGNCVGDDSCLEVLCTECETCESGQCNAIEDHTSCGDPCHSCIAGECVVDDEAGGCPDPISQICMSGQCQYIDEACKGVECPACQSCDSGLCIPDNNLQNCGVCNSCSEGECVPDNDNFNGCESLQCDSGSCVAPDPCLNIECFGCEKCVAGECVLDPDCI